MILPITNQLKDTILEFLHPLAEKWSGLKLLGTSVYGIRRYRNGSWLATHVDKGMVKGFKLKDRDENSIREVIKVEKKMLVLKNTILIFLSFWHDSEQIWKKNVFSPYKMSLT